MKIVAIIFIVPIILLGVLAYFQNSRINSLKGELNSLDNKTNQQIEKVEKNIKITENEVDSLESKIADLENDQCIDKEKLDEIEDVLDIYSFTAGLGGREVLCGP